MTISWESSVIIQMLILFFTLVIGGALGALGYLGKLWINHVISQLTALKNEHATTNRHLSEMNGSVRELKVWSRMHDSEDSKRFDALEQRLLRDGTPKRG